MLSYCLKCRRNSKSKKSNGVKTKKLKNNAFIKLKFAIVKNQDLSKSKKLLSY